MNGTDVKNFAEGIGRTIGKIADFSKSIQKNKPDILEKKLQIQYKDVNINKKTLQYLMGHSSPDITMGIYAEYMAEQQLPETAKKIFSENLRLAMG